VREQGRSLQLYPAILLCLLKNSVETLKQSKSFPGSRRVTAGLGDQNTEKMDFQDTHNAFLDVTATRFCWLPARDTLGSIITESSCKCTKYFHNLPAVSLHRRRRINYHVEDFHKIYCWPEILEW